MQAFGEPFLTLDSAACTGAVQLDSEWTGGFEFAQGLFEDQRRRADHVELDLTPECLSATLGKAIDERHLASTCAALGKSMSQCSVVDGLCHCSGSTEAQLEGVGVYGVVDDPPQITIASDELEQPSWVNYCVEGDLLHWRQSDSVELVLRRTAQEHAPAPDIR